MGEDQDDGEGETVIGKSLLITAFLDASRAAMKPGSISCSFAFRALRGTAGQHTQAASSLCEDCEWSIFPLVMGEDQDGGEGKTVTRGSLLISAFLDASRATMKPRSISCSFAFRAPQGTAGRLTRAATSLLPPHDREVPRSLLLAAPTASDTCSRMSLR